jgi:nicotinamidase-related amidase
MTRVWEPFLTERDRAVFRAAGYGGEKGFKERPAILVIDLNVNFVGDRPEPLLDSIRRFPSSCGEAGWEAMRCLVPVLDLARRKRVPILYSTGDEAHDFLDRTSWGAKVRRDRPPGPPEAGNAIPALIAPDPGEGVLRKKKPSMFFGTPLLQYLVALNVDQVLCCGATTSGCVRATVVDAFSYNYRVAVIEECTVDRGEASHAIALFDMQQKYADVVSVSAILAYLAAVPDGLFPTWAGPDTMVSPGRDGAAGQ